MDRKLLVYMIDGTEYGPRTVEIGNWVGKAIYSNRAYIPKILSRHEVRKPGVYILKSSPVHFSFSERIYIGEAEKIELRLKQQLMDSKRDFEELVFFISKDDLLTKAHVKYLECRLLQDAISAKSAEIDNDNMPNLPVLHEAELSDLEYFLEQIRLILPIMGFKFLIPSSIPRNADTESVSEKEKFYIKSKNFSATMYQSEKGFVVTKGSHLMADMEKIYEHFGVQALSNKRMEAFSRLYYQRDDLRRNINAYSKQFLSEIIYKSYKVGNGLHKSSLLTVLNENELERIEDIQISLPANDRNRVVVSDQQRQEIEAWCQSNQQRALDFHNGSPDDEGNTGQHTARLIFGFQKYFKFNTVNPELLLKMIWDSANHEKLNLDYMDGVVPEKTIEQYLLSILEDDSLSVSEQFFVYQYMKDKELKVPAYEGRLKRETISELIIGNSYYPREIIKMFFENDVPFLKLLLKQFGLDNRHSHFIPFLLDQLKKNGYSEYVELFISTNYSTLIIERVIEEATLISMLIKNNSKFAFELVYQKMQTEAEFSEPIISGYGKSWDSYSNKEAVPVLLDIIDAHISGLNGKGIYDRTTTSAIRMATEALLSIAKAHDEVLCLSTLTDFLSREFIGNDNDDIFYLNGFKRDIDNLISMHRSKPYKLVQAVELLQKYKYDLI